MSEERESREVKVGELKPGMENVTVRVRVLEAGETKTIQTRKGPRTISEAVVGDETGRVRVTLWGQQAGSLQEGEAVEISGAWTTSYRGQVVLNAGTRSEVKRLEDEEVVGESEVPEVYPTAPQGSQQRRSGGRRYGGSRYGGGYRRSYY